MTPQRFMDEIEAWAVADPWIEGLAAEAYRVTGAVQIERWRLTGLEGEMPNGGIITLWVKNRVRAQAVVVRDSWNYSVLTQQEYGESDGDRS